MPAGRPELLNKELLEKARGYLTTCEDKVKEIPQEDGEKGPMKYQVELPSIAGLALYLDITRETVRDWSSNKEDKNELYAEFSAIVKAVLAEQEKRLLNNGISGLYNPTIAKLLLTKHGYSDKQETDITSKGERIADDSKVKELSDKFDEFFKRENS